MRRGPRTCRPGASGSRRTSSRSEAPARARRRRARRVRGGARRPVPVERARVHPGVAPARRTHARQLPERAGPAVPGHRVGDGAPERGDDAPDPRAVLPGRLRAGADAVAPGALGAARPHARPVLHGRHRADVRLGARARQCRRHLASADALHRARCPRGPGPLLHAVHDPRPGRRVEPHRPGVRARGGKPGGAPRARVLAGDAAAVHARHRLRRAHRLRVDAQRFFHARALGRRQGEDDRQRREGPRARLLQLARRRGVRDGGAGADAGAAGRAGPADGGARGVSLRLVVLPLAAFLTVPTVVVIAVSFNPTAILSFPPAGFSLPWYVNVLTYPQFQRAALTTVLVTAWAVALALPIGTLAALALERARLRGRNLWAAALLSPLVVPGVAAGLGFLILAASLGLLRSRSVLIAAHVALVLPFVVRRGWVSVKTLAPARGGAAASLGATPWRVFRRVTLPLLRPGLFTGALFAVVVSVNEFVVSLFISTRVTEILPVAMFTYVVHYTDPTIAALSTLFILATFLAVWVADRYLGLGRVFLQH